MNFHEIRFPENISYGSTGGPMRRTDIVTLANGFEERLTPWADSRRMYNAGIGLRSLDALEELIAFFEARYGQLYGFRWKDWTDYKSCKPSRNVSARDQIIGYGDNKNKIFTLKKIYNSGAYSYTRIIKKPVKGTVHIAVNGNEQIETTDYKFDTKIGQITFLSPPDQNAKITAGFEFDVPVRFDIDNIKISVSAFQAGEIPDIPVIEVRI